MKKVLFTTFILISTLLTTQAQENKYEQKDLKQLVGKWYINYSNFPMWLKGNKTSPTFNYTLGEKKGEKILIDKVEFIKNGKVKSIKGIDKPQNAEHTKFEWHGNGILHLLKSKWSIIHFDETKEWAIIYFDKTLFTPAGYDVISKQKTINKALNTEIKEKLTELDIDGKLTLIEQK